MKISPPKGTRDFYPEDMAVQNSTYTGRFQLLSPGIDYVTDYSKGLLTFNRTLNPQEVVIIDYQNFGGTFLRENGSAGSVTADASGRARGEVATATVIENEAIRHQTATSLAGVLELLPGVEMRAPTLADVQQISLRAAPTSGTGGAAFCKFTAKTPRAREPRSWCKSPARRIAARQRK